jgi:hypothetical protein
LRLPDYGIGQEKDMSKSDDDYAKLLVELQTPPMTYRKSLLLQAATLKYLCLNCRNDGKTPLVHEGEATTCTRCGFKAPTRFFKLAAMSWAGEINGTMMYQHEELLKFVEE